MGSTKKKCSIWIRQVFPLACHTYLSDKSLSVLGTWVQIFFLTQIDMQWETTLRLPFHSSNRTQAVTMFERRNLSRFCPQHTSFTSTSPLSFSKPSSHSDSQHCPASPLGHGELDQPDYARGMKETLSPVHVGTERQKVEQEKQKTRKLSHPSISWKISWTNVFTFGHDLLTICSMYRETFTIELSYQNEKAKGKKKKKTIWTKIMKYRNTFGAKRTSFTEFFCWQKLF